MKAIIRVGLVGAALSVLTLAWPAEGVQALAPFTVLSTAVLLFTFWAVAADKTSARRRDVSTYNRAA